MDFFSTTILLFILLDPFGNIPFILAVLKDLSPERYRMVVIRELLLALAVLLVALFAGNFLLAFLGISNAALTISGGVILFLISIRMVFTGSDTIFQVQKDSDPIFVPIAMPSIAGPSSLATLMLLMARDGGNWPIWLAALLCAWLMTAVTLLFSQVIKKRLHPKGLVALDRLMGMVLVMISVEMLISGVREAMIGIE